MLVTRLGAHPTTRLGLDLGDASAREAWWSTAIVLSGASSEARGLAAARHMLEKGLASPGALAAVEAADLAAPLEALGERRAGPVAARLLRSSRSLAERWRGSLEDLARDADDLEELGTRLVRLAPGVGAATVLRFLRPLRSFWPAAAETPLVPAARAAAVHLGWIGDSDDEEGSPAALRRHWEETHGAPHFHDVEAALEALGRRACLRERAERCPLGGECPAREPGGGPPPGQAS